MLSHRTKAVNPLSLAQNDGSRKKGRCMPPFWSKRVKKGIRMSFFAMKS